MIPLILQLISEFLSSRRAARRGLESHHHSSSRSCGHCHFERYTDAAGRPGAQPSVFNLSMCSSLFTIAM